MSPWVRLQENALDHPKMLGLVDPRRPFDLWVWGLSYTQKHLTDGHLPAAALPRGSAPAAATLITRGLWEADGGNFRVHDYDDWNDRRDAVLKKRAGGRERAAKSRQSHDHRAAHGAVGRGSSDLRSSEGVQGKPFPALAPAPSEDVADRAAKLLETFAELYTKHRHGARFLRLGSNIQWTEACSLCATWDDDTLSKLIEILLTTDDDWVSRTDRGWKIFVAKAQWCAERLAAWEARQVPA